MDRFEGPVFRRPDGSPWPNSHLGQNIREYGRFSRCLRTSRATFVTIYVRDSIGRVRSGRFDDHATGAFDGNGFSAVSSSVPGGG
jgi:hypothetical protein